MSKIIWKDIEGYEDHYQINNAGDIYSYKSKRNLKHTVDKAGYHLISLSKNGKSRRFLVHRLVGFAFVDGYKEGFEINHKDANKSNNNDWNLEWCTHQKNMNHVSDNMLHPLSMPCCIVDDNENIIKWYVSINELCVDLQDEIEINRCNALHCCEGRKNRHKGFKIRHYIIKDESYKKTKSDVENIKRNTTTRRKIKCLENNKTYDSQMDASRDLEINQSGISGVLNGKKKVYKGYTFEYVEFF